MVHSTSTITTQSSSTSTYFSTSETQSSATTTEQPSTAMLTEKTSPAMSTGTSTTTGNIATGTSLKTGTSLTTELVPSPFTAIVSPTSIISSHSPSTFSTYPSTSETLPIATASGTTTTMSTDTSSTAATIAAELSSIPDRPTALQTDAPTDGQETTAVRTFRVTPTETPYASTTVNTATGRAWTTARQSASDSPPLEVHTDGTTTKSVGTMVTDSTHSSRFTGFGTTTGDNVSAGQTNSSVTTIAIAVAVVLSLVCGGVAGVVATVCYRKKTKSRSGHAKVKYVTEENRSASTCESFPGIVNGRVEFENPTFDHIYEELPNVVANHKTSRQDQRPISSSQTDVYMEINDDKIIGAKASSHQNVPTNKSNGHVSSPAQRNAPPPSRQMGGRERQTDNNHEKNAKEALTNRRWEAENDYLSPISNNSNVYNQPNLNHIMNGNEDYELIRNDHYQDLNPLPPADYESLQPDHYQRLNVPEHAPNPDGYQSLRHNQDRHFDVPGHAQNPDGYQSLRHNHRHHLDVPEHAQNPDGYQSLRHNQDRHFDVPEHAPNPDGYQSLRHNQDRHFDVPEHAQNLDGYQSLRRHNQHQNLHHPPHSQENRPAYMPSYPGDGHFYD